MIPARFLRTVPAETADEVEGFWRSFSKYHHDWEMVTFRDPLDPAEFPLTSPSWPACTSGAQRAGLIRLEALLVGGGIYVDSDVECYRSFAPLLRLEAFAAWEDARCVPDAVLGAVPGHPAIRECLRLALEELPRGPWHSGPGVTTRVLPGRPDVLLLPPGAFYPYHYSVKKARRHADHREEQPWSFAAHHWHASWLPG